MSISRSYLFRWEKNQRTYSAEYSRAAEFWQWILRKWTKENSLWELITSCSPGFTSKASLRDGHPPQKVALSKETWCNRALAGTDSQGIEPKKVWWTFSLSWNCLDKPETNFLQPKKNLIAIRTFHKFVFSTFIRRRPHLMRAHVLKKPHLNKKLTHLLQRQTKTWTELISA